VPSFVASTASTASTASRTQATTTTCAAQPGPESSGDADT
jgi:hypothetical protein